MSSALIRWLENPTGVFTRKTGIWVGVLLVTAYLLSSLWRILEGIFTDYNNFGYTEFLINYEGGFVRRGLLGEILYGLCATTGISPFGLIACVCVAAWLAVAVFFIAAFYKRGYSWWILLSPLFCGSAYFLIRKDYLCYLLIIAIMLLVRRQGAGMARFAAVCVLGVFGIFLHEAFVFFGIPIVLLYLLSQEGHRWKGVVFGALACAAFLLQCAFKGDMGVARAIADSWNAILPEPLIQFRKNSIWALGWDTLETFKMHIGMNFRVPSGVYMGLYMQAIFAVVVYYFASNFIFVLRKGRLGGDDISSRTRLSALLLLIMVCMLPMFTVLSCDYARLYQYVLVATFAAYLVLPQAALERMFPARVLGFVARINRTLDSIAYPTRYMMLILLFFLATPPFGFSMTWSVMLSVFGSYMRMIEMAAIIILHHI